MTIRPGQMNKEIKRLEDRVKELEAKLALAEQRGTESHAFLEFYRKAVETSRMRWPAFSPRGPKAA